MNNKNTCRCSLKSRSIIQRISFIIINHDHAVIVVLKCISNVKAVGVFTIYLIIISVSFQNMMNTAKEKHKTFGCIFPEFQAMFPR